MKRSTFRLLPLLLLPMALHAQTYPNQVTPPVAANTGTSSGCANEIPIGEPPSGGGSTTTTTTPGEITTSTPGSGNSTNTSTNGEDDDGGCPKSGSESGNSNSEPSPSTSNPIHSYSGNAQHMIPDLKIFGSVGRLPLRFVRYSATRISNRNLIAGSFGKESGWSHSFDWAMRDAGGTPTQPKLTVSFPNGRELTFLKPADGSSVWYCTLPSRTERLKALPVITRSLPAG